MINGGKLIDIVESYSNPNDAHALPEDATMSQQV